MTWLREEDPYDGDYPESHPGLKLRYKLFLAYLLLGLLVMVVTH